MTTLDKRVEKLEAIVNPKPLEPMVIYTHMTEAECEKFNRPATKGNPLMVVVRSCMEKGGQEDEH